MYPVNKWRKQRKERSRQFFSDAKESFENDNTSKALLLVRKAVRSDPSNIAALLLLGDVLFAEKDFCAAKKHMTSSLYTLLYGGFPGYDKHRDMTTAEGKMCSLIRKGKLEDALGLAKNAATSEERMDVILPVKGHLGTMLVYAADAVTRGMGGRADFFFFFTPWPSSGKAA